jgi:excisionase family DNA binding protein
MLSFQIVTVWCSQEGNKWYVWCRIRYQAFHTSCSGNPLKTDETQRCVMKGDETLRVMELAGNRDSYPTHGQQTRKSTEEASGFGPTVFEATPYVEPVIDSEEAARFLNINPKTLQKMARTGSVPAYRIGKLWKFRISDLDEWLRSKLISGCHSCRENERR